MIFILILEIIPGTLFLHKHQACMSVNDLVSIHYTYRLTNPGLLVRTCNEKSLNTKETANVDIDVTILRRCHDSLHKWN